MVLRIPSEAEFQAADVDPRLGEQRAAPDNVDPEETWKWREEGEKGEHGGNVIVSATVFVLVILVSSFKTVEHVGVG